jgi:flagellar basal body-associated protein FliL
MSMQAVVNIILVIATVYLLCGVVFTAVFLFRGLQKMDEGTHGATVGFKIIIIPGCIVLWPVLLRKWLALKK